MLRYILFASLIVLVSPAIGAAPTQPCVDISGPKTLIDSKNGQWIDLTKDQWLFMAGVYAMNPDTPPGLPPGDKMVLAKVPGHPGGIVFFIDGDKACFPLVVPEDFLPLLLDIATGEIKHMGGGT